MESSMSVRAEHQDLQAVIQLEGPHSVDKGEMRMTQGQKTDASNFVLFGYCTGGTVYVVSFPPFYNMLKPPRAYEAQEWRRVIHSCTVTPEIP